MSKRSTYLPLIVLSIGFFFLSLNTRAPFGQIGPLASSAGFDHALVSLLGLIPPLAMGLAAPLGPRLRHLFGDERALLLASVAEAVGAIVRPFGVAGLVGGTVLASAAIGVINVLIPVLVRRRYSRRGAAIAMAAYALAMGGGSALVAGFTLPLFHASNSWQIAIAIAVVPALLAALAWLPQCWHDEPVEQRPQATHAPHRGGRVWRTWIAWSLLFFFGVQSLLFYTALAWLPTLAIARGAAPASGASLLQLMIVAVAVGGAAGAWIAGRLSDQRSVVAATVALSAAGWAGVALLPLAAAPVFAVVLGLGLGAGQAVPGVLYALRGRGHAHTAAVSTFAQFGGFLIAALGPLLAPMLAGAVREADGASGWVATASALSVLALVNLPLSWAAGRHEGSPSVPTPAVSTQNPAAAREASAN